MDDRQLIADLLSALEYHTEQTRPIQFSKVAIEAAREYLQKPAQQEPVSKKKHEPKIDLGKYAGTYGGYITPEPSENYLQKAYRLANELRSHLSIAPAQRTWQGLTEEEIDKAWRSCDYTVPWEQHRIDIARAIEAKLKEKNR